MSSVGRPINVLVFPCGKENGLELHDALNYCVNINLYGGSSVDDHGRFVYEQYIGNIPFIQSSDFIDVFNLILTKYNIDVVIPTHDTVSLFFAENKQLFTSSIINNDLFSNRVCRSKKMTYELFKTDSFCPRLYTGSELKNKTTIFPAFIKPDIGEGGKGTCVAKNKEEAEFYLNQADEKEMLAVEFLPGLELTVDCFTNKDGELSFIGPRQRNRVQMGISFNCTDYPLTDELKQIAERINIKLSMRGLWYFQVKQDNNAKFKLLEISARCAGTMAFYRQLGVNFPLLSVYDAMEIKVAVHYNQFSLEMDRSVRALYKLGFDYKRVYIDFDDAIIIRGKVNLVAIQYLYECKMNNIETILITRHEEDLNKTLEKFCIHAGLFDSIIRLDFKNCKADFIKGTDSIFIDNAHSERHEVSVKCGIPVFDVDALQCLLKHN
jgi:hypothetical protein